RGWILQVLKEPRPVKREIGEYARQALERACRHLKEAAAIAFTPEDGCKAFVRPVHQDRLNEASTHFGHRPRECRPERLGRLRHGHTRPLKAYAWLRQARQVRRVVGLGRCGRMRRAN